MTVKKIYQHKVNETIRKSSDEHFEVLYIQLENDDELKPHTSLTDAFLLVTHGAIIFSIKNQDHLLKKGDSFSFKAGEMHSVKSEVAASFLLVK